MPESKNFRQISSNFLAITPDRPTLTADTAFSLQMEQEFCTGSAIDSILYAATTRIVSDTEVSAGGEVSYPIHEALNWHLTRFGHQARTALIAILLLNEDGSLSQVKFS